MKNLYIYFAFLLLISANAQQLGTDIILWEHNSKQKDNIFDHKKSLLNYHQPIKDFRESLKTKFH